MQPSRDINRLIEIMARLRTPGSGCPWDLEQSFETIAPYTIEEAFEVADAIARGDLDRGLVDELGDLLLQVIFHARMAEEEKRFDFGDVVLAITEKLLRRHPHVFGDAGKHTPDQVKDLWQRIKAQERAARGDEPERRTLDGVPVALPALMRAQKLQEKAGKVGFDWANARDVLAKIAEEAREIEPVLDDPKAASEEIGDLLFAAVNLARHAGVDAESALRSANVKFERRFRSIEDALKAQGRSPEQATLDEMEALWVAAKERERNR
ncbi:MAG: nucleoside triphosphate pyrophosphohydrolase [Bradyrhizobiaceae bacterium]|nr:nucleoside triphosphate pyrophosphohydrolase [Bradyrhizobiaceae bacterium]